MGRVSFGALGSVSFLQYRPVTLTEGPADDEVVAGPRQLLYHWPRPE